MKLLRVSSWFRINKLLILINELKVNTLIFFNFSIDARKTRCFASYANDSYIPNAVIRTVGVGQEIKLGLYARKESDIEPDTEIVYNYGPTTTEMYWRTVRIFPIDFSNIEWWFKNRIFFSYFILGIKFFVGQFL